MRNACLILLLLSLLAGILAIASSPKKKAIQISRNNLITCFEVREVEPGKDWQDAGWVVVGVTTDGSMHPVGWIYQHPAYAEVFALQMNLLAGGTSILPHPRVRKAIHNPEELRKLVEELQKNIPKRD